MSEELNRELANWIAEEVKKEYLKRPYANQVLGSEEIARRMQKAVELNDAGVQYALGRDSYFGFGVEKSPASAAHWLEMAAEQGDDEAQCLLFSCCILGVGKEKSEDQGYDWLKRAAEQGNALAQKALRRIQEGLQEEAEKAHRSAERLKNRRIAFQILALLGAVLAAYLFTLGTPLYIWTKEHSRELFFLLKPVFQLLAIVLSSLGGAVGVGLLLGSIAVPLGIAGAVAGGVGGLVSIFLYENPDAFQISKIAAFAVMGAAAVLLVIQLIRRIARIGK